MNKTKIYLNNGIEEYQLKKDKYGIPYITINEIIDSLTYNNACTVKLELVKEIIKNCANSEDEEIVGQIVVSGINELLKNIDDEAIKKIVSGINIMLKEIYC